MTGLTAMNRIKNKKKYLIYEIYNNKNNLIEKLSETEGIKDIEVNSNKITIKDLENELLYMYYTPNYQDFKIVPFSKMNKDYLPNYKEVYEKYKNIVTSLNKDIYVKSLE